MTAGSLNTAIIVSLYLSTVLCPSHGFKVLQPEFVTVRSDGTACIRCEFTANININLVEDARLYSFPPSDPSKSEMLCQKGRTNCSNTFMYGETPNKYVFFIFNIDTAAMNLLYQCEITVDIGFDSTAKGTPTRLVAERGPTVEQPAPVTVTSSPTPPVFSSDQFQWIMIGLLALLALLLLYACTISVLYKRSKRSNRDPENSTYVEMRKAPPPNSQTGFDIYCG